MEKIDLFSLIINLIAPLTVVIAIVIVVKNFLNKEIQQAKIHTLKQNQEITLPIRLQAYERLGLLLERVSPSNLLIRLNQGLIPAADFQNIVITEIRNEFNHNISQQVYVSNETWQATKNAIENIISIVNLASQQMDEKSTSLDLSKTIFQHLMENNLDPVEKAMDSLKKELASLF